MAVSVVLKCGSEGVLIELDVDGQKEIRERDVLRYAFSFPGCGSWRNDWSGNFLTAGGEGREERAGRVMCGEAGRSLEDEGTSTYEGCACGQR